MYSTVRYTIETYKIYFREEVPYTSGSSSTESSAVPDMKSED